MIIREYQAARYAVPAPFRTREEIYEKTEALPGGPQRTRFAPLAMSCDRIAFAPSPTTPAEAEALVKSAVEALREEAYRSPEVPHKEPAAGA
jgi:hypothetical protein